MKVKVFAESAGYFGKLAATGATLEGAINDWLAARPGLHIVQIKQSSNGGSMDPTKIVVSIWYEDAPSGGAIGIA